MKRSNTRVSVKSSVRGSQARRGGGLRAKDVLGAHVAASPQVRSHMPAHGQRKDGGGGGLARVLAPVLQLRTSFHALSAADTKLASMLPGMPVELMYVARALQDHHDAS